MWAFLPSAVARRPGSFVISTGCKAANSRRSAIDRCIAESITRGVLMRVKCLGASSEFLVSESRAGPASRHRQMRAPRQSVLARREFPGFAQSADPSVDILERFAGAAVVLIKELRVVAL